MKKLLALLLCVIMVLSMVACNGDTPEETDPIVTDPVVTDPVETTAPPVVEAEALPENPLLYYSFDDATGLSAVVQTAKAADSANDGGTYDIVPTEHEILFSNGPVGQCLYLDGKYGVQLDMSNINITDDSYTISFWLNADRLSTYGPVVQMGRNIGKANTTATVTWLNWTKTTWGTNSADIFPVVWNRNSSIGTDIAVDGVWPWGYAMDDLEHGKREWILFTVVVDGVGYTCADDMLPRIGASYYLDGQLMHFADATNLFYQGVSPEILLADGIEGWIGINYWDTIYKGYVDELYIYDEVLTAGQVKTLFEQGDKNVESVAPEYEWVEPEVTEPVLATITPDANAIDVLGATDLSLGWWTDNTAGYELADGKTMTLKLNNYSDMTANYRNFVLGLCNVALTTDQLAGTAADPSYAEYIVIRPDAWGWTPAANPYGTYTPDWTDWAAWLSLMGDADVTVTITRNGASITGTMTFVGADGTTMNETFEAVDIMAADAPCYVFVGGEGAYIELLSVDVA